MTTRAAKFEYSRRKDMQAKLLVNGRTMQRVKGCLSIMGLVAAMAAGVPGVAQTQDREASRNSRIVSAPVKMVDLVPFALGPTGQDNPQAIGFRPARALSPEDSQLISNRWAALKKKALVSGFNLDGKGWNYEQILSPAFSEHVLLLFRQGGASGDVSEFSVLIPHTGKEPILVIPILRRGYLPYSAPQEDPVAMAAFNRALAGERANGKPYWVWVSSCYAALNGAHAILGSAPADMGQDRSAGWLAVPTPSLHAEDNGGAVARFAVQRAPGRLSEWKLTFDKNGNLIRAETSPIQAPHLKVVKPAQLKSRRY